MPLSKLLVEGKLDAIIYGALLRGAPAVEQAGAKDGLARKVREQRSLLPPVLAAYLRDRDFDHLPPQGTERLDTPIVDREEGGGPLGYRTCRHELESYLLQPSLVAEALGWDAGEYTKALVSAGKEIREYQIARWTVGRAKRALPPYQDYRTRPDECGKDFSLPADLSHAACQRWAYHQSAHFLSGVQGVLAVDAVAQGLAEFAGLLDVARLEQVEQLLLWCSGKDLLASLVPWLPGQGCAHPTLFCHAVRDFIISHPDAAAQHVPEWGALRGLLRAA